jgi:hypothetical protein
MYRLLAHTKEGVLKGLLKGGPGVHRKVILPLSLFIMCDSPR